MFSHIMVGSNDIEQSRKFYDAIFTASGGSVCVKDPSGRLIYSKGGNRFMVTAPINGEPACHANGGTIGFALSSPDEVEAWHSAGVENGGTTAENPPGIRDLGTRKLYLAYLRDPAGNKLCASALVA